MFIDVVIPNKNEQEFIELACRLGIGGLIFLYDKGREGNLDRLKELKKEHIKVYSATLAKDSMSKKKYDFLYSKGDRKHLESKKTDVVFEIEKGQKKDNYHYRNSGLNQVLCALAHDKEITVAFSFNSVLTSKTRSEVLGKMMQNAMLCKKYKVEMMIASFARKPAEMRFWKDLVSFGVTIGLSTIEAKNAVLNRKV